MQYAQRPEEESTVGEILEDKHLWIGGKGQ